MLHFSVQKCYAAAQAEYIQAYNAKAIEANLSKIAAQQCTEECAIIISSRHRPTPRIVGATIDDRIGRNQQDLEKRLQSLEQKLFHEKTNPPPLNAASINK